MVLCAFNHVVGTTDKREKGSMSRQKNVKIDSDTLHRVPVVMPLDLADYLADLGSEAKRNGGFKLAKTTIIRALIRAMLIIDEKVKIDLTGVKEEGQLIDRLLDTYHRYRRK
jgi:hypothetical protein